MMHRAVALQVEPLWLPRRPACRWPRAAHCVPRSSVLGTAGQHGRPANTSLRVRRRAGPVIMASTPEQGRFRWYPARPAESRLRCRFDVKPRRSCRWPSTRLRTKEALGIRGSTRNRFCGGSIGDFTLVSSGYCRATSCILYPVPHQPNRTWTRLQRTATSPTPVQRASPRATPSCRIVRLSRTTTAGAAKGPVQMKPPSPTARQSASDPFLLAVRYASSAK